jgi:FkbM family methyltransferase
MTETVFAKKKTTITLTICLLLFGVYFIFYSQVKAVDYSPSFLSTLSNRIKNKSIDISSTRSNKFVYIDLGANTGDSVYDFFNAKSSKYPKIFNSTDGGRSDWSVYAFEANPQFDAQLDAMKMRLENTTRQINIHLYKSTAAWIYNGNVTFYLDTVNKKHNFWGSSIDSNHPDVVRSNRTRISVSCVDIADVVEKFTKRDTIVLKMDVEGVENELLVHLIVRKVFDLIDYLAIEYHDDIYGKARRSEDFILNKIFEKSNVTILKWV